MEVKSLSEDWAFTDFAALQKSAAREIQMFLLLYLIVTLLGKETTLSDDQVESSTGHQEAMTHVTKHHRKQKGERDDGIWSCNRWNTEQDHHKG